MAAQTREHDVAAAGKTRLIADPGTLEIVISRLFDVGRSALYRALTDPALIPHWCGAPEAPNTAVDLMDVRPGGSWRWRFIGPAGNAVGLHGVYHDVAAPERLVYTFEFEGVPDHVLLRTVTLEERGSHTLLTEQSVFQSVEDRDGMLQSGIKGGTVASWDRLEALLRKE